MADPDVAFPECVPVLTDGVVTLRAHRPGDAQALHETASEAQSQRWTSVPRDYTVQDAEEFLGFIEAQWNDRKGVRIWAIEYTDDAGEPVFGGSIDLRPNRLGTSGIGYGLHPAARGRGVMARAVRLACRHAFAVGFSAGPVSRVHWEAFLGNWPSRRVAWACGFTMHGTIPQYAGLPGMPEDCWVGSLGAGEPMTPQTRWLEPPEVAGLGIRLRAWREDDVDAVEPLADPGHFMPPAAAPTAETFERWLLVRRERMAAGEGYYWCIADETTDRALGTVMVFAHGQRVGPPSAELGYFLFPSARGRGAVQEAVRLAIGAAFADPSTGSGGLGLTRLCAITAPDNAASNAVLAGAGFRQWGVEHGAYALPCGGAGNGLNWELLAPRG